MKPASGNARAKNRITLLAIMAVFVVPFVLAWAMALGPSSWRPDSTLNHGVLLQPPLSLHSYGVKAADGCEINEGAVAGDWFLVVLYTPSCASACRELVQTANGIRLAVGPDSQRVNIALLGPDKADQALPVGNWVLPAGEGLMAELGRAVSEQHPNNLLLIVDYRGYIVLAYPTIDDVYGPLRDLETLLSAVPG